MPTNNFKLFDENKANLLADTEYGNSTQRLNGVQAGVASSQLNNKFAYQVSLVAYSIAQLMNANGLDASDTLAVSAFVGNLQGAILQKVADKATSAEAAAGVLSNKYITPETMKAAALLLSGGVMNGVIDMGNNRITNLGTPTADSDAVTKGYVDRFGKIQIGSYIGLGGYGVNNKNSLTFNFEPKCLIIRPSLGASVSQPYGYTFLWVYNMTIVPQVSTSSSSNINNTVILSDKTISWYNNASSSGSSLYQFNSKDIEYCWICLG